MSDANRTQMLTNDPNRTQMATAPTLDPNRTVMGNAPSLNATQTIKPVQCPICKTFNPVGVMFCVECGLIFDRALPADAFGAPAVQLPMLVESSGREHPLRPGLTVIGREADIAIPDSRISRRHAQISNEDGALCIEDIGSTNGTKVNGNALAQGEKVALNAGDKLSFGGVECGLSFPGGPNSNTTQAFGGNKTAAIAAPPKAPASAGRLVGSGYDLPLKEGVNTFGRRDSNDVVIPDPYVSGKHGQIELTPDGVFLTDLGSTNGTLLNDIKLGANMRTAMAKDDVIRLGSLELKVVLA